MTHSPQKSVEVYRNDLDYWLERHKECQAALNVVESQGKTSDSAGKLKGKLEAYEEIITYFHKKVGN